MRALTLVFLTLAMLRCQLETVSYWRSVLLFGHLEAAREYPVDGRERRVLFISYHKRAFVFVYQYPDIPGARERGAWHGCGLYELPNHQIG